MELGIYTFGDITPDPNTGRAISIPQRYAEILAAAKLADEAGLDVFGVGEHHRLDIPISSPAVVMAAVAGGTKRIRLTSAVTILSTLDPVRVFQDFATEMRVAIQAGSFLAFHDGGHARWLWQRQYADDRGRGTASKKAAIPNRRSASGGLPFDALASAARSARPRLMPGRIPIMRGPLNHTRIVQFFRAV